MRSWNGNIFRVTFPLCGEFTGDVGNSSVVTLVFSLICAWTNGNIWDAILLIMTSMLCFAFVLLFVWYNKYRFSSALVHWIGINATLSERQFGEPTRYGWIIRYLTTTKRESCAWISRFTNYNHYYTEQIKPASTLHSHKTQQNANLVNNVWGVL